MSGVDLGFVNRNEKEPWRLQSNQFPSKVGGKPAWLSLENLPKPEQLLCKTCEEPMIFLCQIYAPYEDDEENFHRTIFIFICRNGKCCQQNSNNNIKVFRSSLSRENKFYLATPPEEKDEKENYFNASKWVRLCNLCGTLGEKVCSQCKKVAYCSKIHQIIDWREHHKVGCGRDCISTNSSKLFPEYEILMEEELIVNDKLTDEAEELKKFEELKRVGKAGTMNDTSLEELEAHALNYKDKTFLHFKKVISLEPEQILRYHRGKSPLWISDIPKPQTLPKCDHCDGERQFEFQIMPQLLSFLNVDELDWGILAVFTCKESCTNGSDYKEEFIFKQDISKSKDCLEDI